MLNFKLSPSTLVSSASGSLSQTPPVIDELYLRVFLGPLTLETGLRKLAWGRADIQGPLDVTNPLDYTDLTKAGDTMGRKIARPMIHASLPLGGASTVEAVFIPSFQGHRYSLDTDDHWYPTAITSGRRDRMIDDLIGELGRILPSAYSPLVSGIGVSMKNQAAGLTSSDLPDTRGLEYAQGGLRFTTTLGPADIGAQYYHGHLFRPAFTLNGADDLLAAVSANPASIASWTSTPPVLTPHISYSRYHQIGFDYTQVIFDVSFRAEVAAHITGDLGGDDGDVYNPFLAWSAGFDRDIVGLTFFVEVDESIRLLNDELGSNAALDTEAGSPLTTTALTTQLSRTFFQDRLEAKFGLLWHIEAGDVYLMPSLSYSMDNVEAVLSGGIFAGRDGGELSQYRNKAYIKTALSYAF